MPYVIRRRGGLGITTHRRTMERYRLKPREIDVVRYTQEVHDITL